MSAPAFLVPRRVSTDGTVLTPPPLRYWPTGAPFVVVRTPVADVFRVTAGRRIPVSWSWRVSGCIEVAR